MTSLVESQMLCVWQCAGGKFTLCGGGGGVTLGLFV